jgi:hypothetical protein
VLLAAAAAGSARKRPLILQQGAGDPVLSVDTKKKELAGAYKNGGREWRPRGEPVDVNTHDFPDAELGKARQGHPVRGL